MRAKKRTIMLLTPLLMSMSVSAAALVLNDAQWSSMGLGEFTEPGFSGSITDTTDYPRDPGYRWDVNVVEGGVGYDLGLLGIGSTTNTLGMSITPGGDTWSVEFTNPGTNPANYGVVAMAAYVTAPGGAYTGWVIRPQDLEERIYEGETKTVEWNFATGEALDGSILPITSVQKLGLLFIGDVGGVPGGAGEDISIIVGSPATVVLNDAQWSSMVVDPHNPFFNGSIISTINYPRDPGYQWNVNVVKSGADFGLLGIGADTSTMGITVNPGDLWSADLTNPGTNAANYNAYMLAAYVTAAGGAYTGWVVRPQDGEEIIFEGDSKTVEWDLTTGDVLGATPGLPITSVQKLGLVFVGDLNGAPGGESFSLLVGSAEPVEVVPYDYNFWLADEYPDFITDNGKTDNPDGDALDNWNEYAFGGNPTNGAVTGYPVEYGLVEDGETYMAYIHAQRIDSEDLDYVVEICSDLVLGSWTNENVIISGTNESFAADFVGVTNLVPADVEQRFIRIKAVEK